MRKNLFLIIFIFFSFSCSKSHRTSEDGGVDTFLEDIYIQDTYIQEDVEQNCEAQDVQEDPQVWCDMCIDCIATPYVWDGQKCVFTKFCCGCIGEDCDNLFSTLQDCQAAYQQCNSNYPQPLYPEAKLQWRVSAGYTGYGPVLMMDGNGFIRVWNNVEPNRVDWNSTDYDYSENLGVEAANGIFTQLSIIDYSLLPHEPETWYECYPSFYLKLCENCPDIYLNYQTAEDLLPEFSNIYDWFNERLCRGIDILSLPQNFCVFQSPDQNTWIVKLTNINDSYNSYPNYVIRNNDNNGYIVAGITTEDNENSIYVAELNSDGSVGWLKIYKDRLFWTVTNSIISSNDGYILSGSMGSDSDLPEGSSRMWFIKIDNNGNILWQKKISSPFEDYPYSITVSNDGGIIIAGYNSVYGIEILKLNASGAIVWHKTIGIQSYNNIRSIASTSDGGFIVTGSVYPDENTLYQDILVIKFNSYGEIIWQKAIGESDSQDYGYSIIETYDGNFLILANSDSNENNNSQDTTIIKIDMNGHIIWQKTFPGLQNNPGDSIITTYDHRIVFIAMTDSFEIEIIKLNEFGSIIWQKNIDLPGRSYAYSLIEDSDRNIVVSGLTSGDDSQQYNNLMLIKLNDQGDIDCDLVRNSELFVYDTNMIVQNANLELYNYTYYVDDSSFTAQDLTPESEFICGI